MGVVKLGGLKPDVPADIPGGGLGACPVYCYSSRPERVPLPGEEYLKNPEERKRSRPKDPVWVGG